MVGSRPDTIELCLRCGRGLVYRAQPDHCYCPTCGGSAPGAVYRYERMADEQQEKEEQR